MAEPQDFWQPYWIDDEPVGPGGVAPMLPEFAPAGFPANDMPIGPPGGMDAPPDMRMPADPYEQQAPLDPYAAQGMQPGIGIPAEMLEQAMPAPMDPAPMDPYADQPFDPWAEQPTPIVDQRVPDDPYAWRGDPLQNPDQDELNAYVAGLAVNDPQAFAEHQIKQQAAAESDAATAYLDASLKHQKRVADEHRDYMAALTETAQKMAALDAQVVDLMSRKVDPDRWWNSRSTGQKLSAFLGVIAGGIAAGQAGNNSGRNSVMEDLQHTIDQDIAAQKFDIENGQQGVAARRGILAQEYARTGDMSQATKAVELASWASIQGDLLAQQQLRDPRGTQAMKIGTAAQEIQGRMAASRAAAEAADFERRLKLSEQMRKWAETEEERRKNLAAEAAAAAKLAAKGSGVGKQKARPIVPTKSGWAKQERIETWGADAERAYAEEVANIQRAQAEWDKTGGRSGGSKRSVAQPGAVSSPATVAEPSAPPAQPQSAAVQPAIEQPRARAYQSEDDWFEANTPTATSDVKKQFWFVDGDSGNEVPPVKISAIEDPQKFGKRQRIRQQMATKSSQLLVLTERLQKRGFWDKAVNSKVNWKNDEDVQEARALAEDLTGDVLQAKEMGVPSGNDVERVKTMIGRDPAGWQNPIPNLQRARESWQSEQDADWKTNAPAAFKDNRYNKYRVLPTKAPADWIAKVQRRGEIKEVAPEMGVTDPKQIKGREVEGDAKSFEQQGAARDRDQRVEEARDYLRLTGATPDPDFAEKAAQLVPTNSSRAVPAPHQDDFKFAGKPAAKPAFALLRAQHVSAAGVLNRYVVNQNPKDWTAYRKHIAELSESLGDIFDADRELYERYEPQLRASKGRLDDPRMVAKIAGEILASGGK